ncbi:MAG: hypothetical protein ABIG71_01310 [Candidatus Uhrbacteria bacterium]
MEVPQQTPEEQDVTLRSTGSRNRLPPIVAKTTNIFVGGAKGVHRTVAHPIRRRYDRHYHPRRPHGRKHLIADLCFVAAIAALIGLNAYLLIAQPNIFSKVQLSLEVPSSVQLGAAFEVKIAYSYDGDELLSDVTIALQADRLSILSVEPGTFDKRTNTIALPGTIAPGASGTVSFRAVTNAPMESDVQIRGTFHGVGATRSERRVIDTSIRVQGIAMSLVFEAPDIIPAHGFAKLAYQVSSRFEQPLWPITIVPEASGMTLSNAEAETYTHTEDSVSTWHDIHVRTSDSGTFPLRFRIERGARDDSPRELLGVLTHDVIVRDVPITVSLEVGTPSAPVEHVALGVEFPVTVHVGMNAGSAGILIDPFVDIMLDGPLAASSFSRNGDGLISPRGPRWLAPSGEVGGVLSYEASIIVPSTVDVERFSDDVAFQYVLTPRFVIDANSVSGIEHAGIVGESVVIPIVGELRLVSYARYFTQEGDQIGRGPLPPRVGATTSYWVTWDVRSVLQDAQQIVVRAQLPEGVEWTGRVAATAGHRVEFNPTTRSITWVVDTLDQTVGKTFPSASASFELALTPSAEQVGVSALLLDHAQAQYSDSVGDRSTVEAPAVTTNLLLDSHARGMGSVRD